MRPAPPDKAARDIVLSNALTVALAWWAGDGLLLMIWPYWAQSVIIGFYAQRRIRLLRDFSTEGLRIGGRRAEPTARTRAWTANFFVIHYGLFHLAYLFFLTALARAGGKDPALDIGDGVYVALAAASFLWTHRQSHREHVAADLGGRPNLGALMFAPYLRVVPMHLTIILGTMLGTGASGVLLFGMLKTVADVAMHKVEHRLLQRSGDASGPASFPT